MDSSEEEVLFLNAAAGYMVQKRSRKRPRFWARNFLRKRELEGTSSLMNDLLIQDAQGYTNFIRMPPHVFELLLEKVAPFIKKNDTNFRKAIDPVDQLIITLRFLATGDSYASLMYSSRVSKTKISEIIPVVCKYITTVLVEYVKTPTTAEEWKQVAAVFNQKWNFPNCIGALDGKHIQLIKPAHSGSDYFNYKKCFSIVLLALVDANYNFIYVDIGVQGRISDGGIFNSTNLCRLLKNEQLGLPQPHPLPGRLGNSPHVIVADDAFALSTNLIKPYPGCQVNGSPERIFNYRLSRARVVSENAFGIISARFRVLRQSILLAPDKASLIVLACVYLHNFLRKVSSNSYTPSGSFDYYDNENGSITHGSWRGNDPGLLQLQRLPRREPQTAIAIRNEFRDYFMTDIGSVSWQNQYC